MNLLPYFAFLWVVLIFAIWPRKVLVTRIVDGDSLEVRRGKRHLRVRIFGLDAPEYRQPYGRAALRALEEMIDGRTVRLCWGHTDVYGRTVTRCLVDWRPVHWKMISAGHAWPCSPIGVLLSIPPRVLRKGLWCDPQRIHPRLWRKANELNHPGMLLD